MPKVELTTETKQMIIDNIHYCASEGGYFIEIGKLDKRSIAQNRACHRLLSVLSKTRLHYDNRLTVDEWKRLTMAAFLREEGYSPKVIPSLDGYGFDVVYQKTSKLSVSMMAKYIEWLEAFVNC